MATTASTTFHPIVSRSRASPRRRNASPVGVVVVIANRSSCPTVWRVPCSWSCAWSAGPAGSPAVVKAAAGEMHYDEPPDDHGDDTEEDLES